MPDGYLVQLGDNSLDAGDSIVDPLVTFTTDQALGSGNWEWSGTWNGTTFTNESEPGEFFLATDGNVYFVPDFGPVDTLTAATATSAPSFINATEIIGTPGDDDPLDGTSDDDFIDGLTGDDVIDAGAGNDNVLGGGGNDDITGGGGADTVNAGDGDDTVSGGAQADTLLGGAGTDELSGDAGADIIVGGSGNDSLDGGSGDDTIYGDQDPSQPDAQVLRWSDLGGNNTDLTGGATTTLGDTVVTVSITDDGALTSAEIDTGTAQYTETGEPFGTNSALEIAGDGGSDAATIRVDFASTDDNDSLDAAENVSFRLNDIDSGGWTDTLTINAFDVDGNPVAVTITPEDAGNSVSGNSVTSGVANGNANSASGSVLVEIAGPVAYFEVSYGNDGTSGQRAWLSDISFETARAPDGDDTLDGGLGADELYGGGGNDLFALADGDSAFGEDGDDTFTLGDLGEGAGTITIDGGEGGESAGDTIQLSGQAQLTDVVYNVGDPESGTITLNDGTVVNFSNIENIICFTPGTAIATPHGTRAIETLRKGDLVLTRDHGPQPIRWIGSRTVPATGNFAPIEITPRAFPDASTSLLVSPQHRMLFTGYRAELLFGEREVLVAAKHLVDGHAVRLSRQPFVTYIHIMFDAHEIITANGALTESFFAGDQSLSAIADADRNELFQLFPNLRLETQGPTARRALKAYEAALL